jgi:hypothetical protein
MNTGQLLLVIAALSLLTTLALSINRTLLDNDTMMIEAQSGVLAVSLGRGEIDRNIRVDFESLAVGETVDTLFTPYSAFVCTTQVDYVEAAAPSTAVAGPTSLKRVQVTVSSDYMTGAVTFSALVGDY